MSYYLRKVGEIFFDVLKCWTFGFEVRVFGHSEALPRLRHLLSRASKAGMIQWDESWMSPGYVHHK
jgi:hypothetical protein